MASSCFRHVVDRLAADIRNGILQAGSRLPPHRELARTHGLATSTASRVYAELARLGLVIGEVGRGTYVREATSQFPGTDLPRSLSLGVDLSSNNPLADHQDAQLRTALRQLAKMGDLEALLCYQPPLGRMRERELVAAYLNQRHLPVDPALVATVEGAQHGLTVVLMASLRPGDRILVDTLTYPGLKLLAELLALELVPVPISAAGPDLDALRQECSRPRVKAIYCMPTLHNPLGVVLNLEQRQRIVEIARDHGLLIIEDAAYAYLAGYGQPSLYELAPECTFYVNSLSKNVATGLRFGFVVAPPTLIAAVSRAIRATISNSAAIIRALACGWLQDGTVDALELLRREDAAARQAIAREALSGLPLLAHPNAYFLWLPLPGRDRAEAICRDLAAQAIAVSTAEPFAVGPRVPNALRLALSTPEPDTLRRALIQVRARIEQFAD